MGSQCGMIFALTGHELPGGNMISFNRIPTHIDTYTLRRRARKNIQDNKEEETADFEELFQVVSENIETSNPQNHPPSKKNHKQLTKRSKLDLSI